VELPTTDVNVTMNNLSKMLCGQLTTNFNSKCYACWNVLWQLLYFDLVFIFLQVNNLSTMDSIQRLQCCHVFSISAHHSSSSYTD